MKKAKTGAPSCDCDEEKRPAGDTGELHHGCAEQGVTLPLFGRRQTDQTGVPLFTRSLDGFATLSLLQIIIRMTIKMYPHKTARKERRSSLTAKQPIHYSSRYVHCDPPTECTWYFEPTTRMAPQTLANWYHIENVRRAIKGDPTATLECLKLPQTSHKGYSEHKLQRFEPTSQYGGRKRSIPGVPKACLISLISIGLLFDEIYPRSARMWITVGSK
ncbi:hypothetical protein DFH09DRAFT_1081541 [Mycena vulgaris]|nr:hypothetical protein DFH09DRAFT_1081541 [Mycena vulgaris]